MLVGGEAPLFAEHLQWAAVWGVPVHRDREDIAVKEEALYCFHFFRVESMKAYGRCGIENLCWIY